MCWNEHVLQSVNDWVTRTNSGVPHLDFEIAQPSCPAMSSAIVRGFCLLLLLLLAGGIAAAEPRLKKTKQYFLDATKESPLEPGQDRYIEFERKRALYGAVTPSDQRERYGNYFTFFWEAPERADV